MTSTKWSLNLIPAEDRNWYKPAMAQTSVYSVRLGQPCNMFKYYTTVPFHPQTISSPFSTTAHVLNIMIHLSGCQIFFYPPPFHFFSLTFTQAQTLIHWRLFRSWSLKLVQRNGTTWSIGGKTRPALLAAYQQLWCNLSTLSFCILMTLLLMSKTFPVSP